MVLKHLFWITADVMRVRVHKLLVKLFLINFWKSFDLNSDPLSDLRNHIVPRGQNQQ